MKTEKLTQKAKTEIRTNYMLELNRLEIFEQYVDKSMTIDFIDTINDDLLTVTNYINSINESKTKKQIEIFTEFSVLVKLLYNNTCYRTHAYIGNSKQSYFEEHIVNMEQINYMPKQVLESFQNIIKLVSFIACNEINSARHLTGKLRDLYSYGMEYTQYVDNYIPELEKEAKKCLPTIIYKEENIPIINVYKYLVLDENIFLNFVKTWANIAGDKHTFAYTNGKASKNYSRYYAIKGFRTTLLKAVGDINTFIEFISYVYVLKNYNIYDHISAEISIARIYPIIPVYINGKRTDVTRKDIELKKAGSICSYLAKCIETNIFETGSYNHKYNLNMPWDEFNKIQFINIVDNNVETKALKIVECGLLSKLSYNIKNRYKYNIKSSPSMEYNHPLFILFINISKKVNLAIFKNIMLNYKNILYTDYFDALIKHYHYVSPKCRLNFDDVYTDILTHVSYTTVAITALAAVSMFVENPQQILQEYMFTIKEELNDDVKTVGGKWRLNDLIELIETRYINIGSERDNDKYRLVNDTIYIVFNC